MKIQTQRQGAITVIRPDGAMIEADADQLKLVLVDHATANLGRVVLDMELVTFIDSRGLEVLVEVTEELQNSGQALKICSANKTLREVMELTEVSNLFEHFEDVNSAGRSFL